MYVTHIPTQCGKSTVRKFICHVLTFLKRNLLLFRSHPDEHEDSGNNTGVDQDHTYSRHVRHHNPIRHNLHSSIHFHY